MGKWWDRAKGHNRIFHKAHRLPLMASVMESVMEEQRKTKIDGRIRGENR